MARLSEEEKINKLEEQISQLKEKKKEEQKALKKKQRQELTKKQRNIGKTIMQEWGIEDEEIIYKVINDLSDQAQSIINENVNDNEQKQTES